MTQLNINATSRSEQDFVLTKLSRLRFDCRFDSSDSAIESHIQWNQLKFQKNLLLCSGQKLICLRYSFEPWETSNRTYHFNSKYKICFWTNSRNHNFITSFHLWNCHILRRKTTNFVYSTVLTWGKFHKMYIVFNVLIRWISSNLFR